MLGRKMRVSGGRRSLSKLLDIKSLRQLDGHSQYTPSPLTLGQLVQFGRSASEEDSFNFLKRELPVRMANIMKEINLLPSNLLQMPSILLLQEWYAKSYVELSSFESREGDQTTLQDFIRSLSLSQRRHVNAVQTMAQGVMELQESHAVDGPTENSIQYFLDRFYMSRLSTRMLSNQHTMLFGEEELRDERPNRVGMIDTECRLDKVVQEAYDNAAFLCQEYYAMAPDIDLEVVNNQSDQGEKQGIAICYPPQHLYHILFELMKNAMRAVVEYNSHTAEKTAKSGGRKRLKNLPDLSVLIAKGDYDVSIRISDRGGGIPRHVTDRLFTYLYSTAPRPSMQASKTPLAGYGYGLPLSRLYARYFHGDLLLNSYEGHGTDAVVYIKTDAKEAAELLPVFNTTSSKHYRNAIATADWTDPHVAMARGSSYLPRALSGH